ncbi:MAG TPA: rhomboid family intramembrane serine protease [Rhizomicrobium sp.]|nr:rhomboid family intramembrane serine protease [Rhizomicrobium sp.]
MIPISDDNPTRHPAVVNWLLIGACVAVFVWELTLGGQGEAAIRLYGFVPQTLHGDRMPGGALAGWPAWTTIFTSMFLHGGVLHIAGNMLFLWIFGNNVEDAMGHFNYLVFYLVSGVAAAMTMYAMDPGSAIPMVGASGAISGVLAAYVLLYPKAPVTVIVPLGIVFYPMRVSAVFVVGLWFAIQLFSAWMSNPTQPGVAFWAHVGGFGAGLLLTPIFKSSDIPLFGRVRRGPWG